MCFIQNAESMRHTAAIHAFLAGNGYDTQREVPAGNMMEMQCDDDSVLTNYIN